MLKIRQSRDCLIFNMGIPIPGKTVFILRRSPGSYVASYTVIPVHASQVKVGEIRIVRASPWTGESPPTPTVSFLRPTWSWLGAYHNYRFKSNNNQITNYQLTLLKLQTDIFHSHLCILSADAVAGRVRLKTGMILTLIDTQYKILLCDNQIDGLVRERCNSSVLAMELCLSCINPLKCDHSYEIYFVDMMLISHQANIRPVSTDLLNDLAKSHWHLELILRKIVFQNSWRPTTLWRNFSSFMQSALCLQMPQQGQWWPCLSFWYVWN